MATALQSFILRRLRELKAIVPTQLLQAVVEEMAYAIEPPIHEGLQPSFGAVITNDLSLLHPGLIEKYRGRTFELTSISEMRCIADGVRCFYCRHVSATDSDKSLVWVSESISFMSEVALFSLRDEAVFGAPRVSPHKQRPPEKDLLLVQRNRSGEVTLLCTSGIISIKDGQWTKRIYQYQLGLEEYCAHSAVEASDHHSELVRTYRSLARLALHILGARRIGATLIIESSPGKLSVDGLNLIGTDKAIHVNEAGLTLREKGHQTLMAHLLEHNDGAAIFSQRGNLISVRNWLNIQFTEDDIKANPGGTRQLSALVASKKLRLPVITVSSDGPVRAFYKGALVRG